ncbi:MAG: Voltage-gated ClC-type chloride channel ClcB [Verrucomicrobia bacterium ADurb.Bin063]|nr:MAG: Voltage-gated ClC-type chloride channel ClcB [Verrucomicrobia bacterium ADurb.Bin063]
MPWLRSKRLVEGAHAYFLRHWQRWLRVRWRVRFSEDAFNLLMAAGVGVIGGLVNIFFYYATELVRVLFLRQPGELVEVAERMAPWQRVVTPTLGGLCAGLVLYWGLRMVGPQRSSNLLEVIVAGDGRLPLRTGLVKFLSSLVTIGSGGSIGREGGITQLSATFASKWGQLMKWHPYRLRLLVGCGAASGIAAAYNAPISGAVFAALIVMGNFSMSLFAPLVCASVVATMESRSFFGIEPWYSVPPYVLTSVTQLPWFVCLGLVVGVLGAVFMKLLNAASAGFRRLPVPIFLRLALGGLLVGLIAVRFPEVWGNGYVAANRILHGEYGAPTFTARDIADLESLAGRLKQPAREDGVSTYLGALLAPETVVLLGDYQGGENRRLARALTADLNRIVRSGALYETQRFAGVRLSEETRRMLERDAHGVDLARLNCRLLLEAYPHEMASAHWREAAATGLLVLAGGGEDFPVAAFAVVGMGSMLSATTRSPLLAMIMVFEISLDYSLMPALMLACVLSMLVARRLHPETIYTEPLRHKGLRVPQEPSASEAVAERSVGDLMRAPVPPVRETTTLQEIAARFLTSANNFLPVVDAKGQLVGLVALQDLKEYLGSQEELRGIIAYDFMRPPPACVTPNQRLADVLSVVLASEQRNIPVVNTLKENRLVGALPRAQVLRLFSEAIAASSKAEA